MKNLSGAAKKNAVMVLRKAAAWAILAGCGLALVRCEDRLAGSSVTTGNPTEIQVGFTGENGPVAISGRVDIYGATQVPIAGFHHEPLATYDVNGKEDFLLNASRFDGIADSLWPMGSKDGDSLVRFNLVVTGVKQGAILRNLVFLLNQGKFMLMDGSWKEGAGGVGLVSVGITDLVEYNAVIDPKILSDKRLNYLFLKGTGYSAKSDSGHFRFPGVPMGTHPISFISLPDKGQILDPEDSAYVYGVDKPLVAGRVDTLSATEIDIRFPMPDAFNK